MAEPVDAHQAFFSTCGSSQAPITQGDDDTEQRLWGPWPGCCKKTDTIRVAAAGEDSPAGSFELENVMLTSDAFFDPVEQVPVEQAVCRIAAEMVNPYPPGVCVLARGERVNAELLEYLTGGKPAGMLIPEADDASIKTLRVVGG